MEGLTEQRKHIGTSDYLVRQLPGREGRKVLARFVQMNQRKDGMNPEEMEFFTETFARFTDVEKEGKGIILSGIFDLHFRGKMKEMSDWLAFCFEVNFSDFLSEAGATGLLPSPQAPAAT